MKRKAIQHKSIAQMRGLKINDPRLRGGLQAGAKRDAGGA
jgi:hypothetical protein